MDASSPLRHIPYKASSTFGRRNEQLAASFCPVPRCMAVLRPAFTAATTPCSMTPASGSRYRDYPWTVDEDNPRWIPMSAFDSCLFLALLAWRLGMKRLRGPLLRRYWRRGPILHL